MSKEEKGNHGAAARKALDAMAKQAATNGAKRKDLLYTFPRVNTTSNREGRGGKPLFARESVFLALFQRLLPPLGSAKGEKEKEGEEGGGRKNRNLCLLRHPGKGKERRGK